MNNFVFIEERLSAQQFWGMISWCHRELDYTPKTQTSEVCYAFKFDNEIDAMAFKLRWL